MVSVNDILFEVDNLEIHMRHYRKQGLKKIFELFDEVMLNGDNDLREMLKLRVKDKIQIQMNSYYSDNNSIKHKEAIDFFKDFVNINKIVDLKQLAINNMDSLKHQIYVDWFCDKHKIKKKELSFFKDLVVCLNGDSPNKFKAFINENEKHTNVTSGMLKYMDLLNKKGILTTQLIEKFYACSGLTYQQFFIITKDFLNENHINYFQNKGGSKVLKSILEVISEDKKDNFLKDIYEKNSNNIYQAIHNSDILMKFLVDNKYEEFLIQHFSLEKLNVKVLDNFQKVISFYEKNFTGKQLFDVLSNTDILEKLEKVNHSPTIKNFILQNKLGINEDKTIKRMKI